MPGSSADTAAIPTRYFHTGAWNLMAHGFVFADYDRQSGPRGASQLGLLDWGMLMAMRNVASGHFQARAMLSFDAAGVTEHGYPLLLQTGESVDGTPLHDRQHPHDLFMELGVMYDHPVVAGVSGSIYAAPAGEPALGPVAYMHRPSSMDNPAAPIGHHWQDATHVSFGVLTVGLFTRTLRLEGSLFNGREPDQNRWDIDPIRFDSYAGRVSYQPVPQWTVSASYGFLKTPEALTPELSMRRVTASTTFGRTLGDSGQLAMTWLWGANAHSDVPRLTRSGLAEAEYIIDARNTAFARAEVVQKRTEDLVLVGSQAGASPATTYGVAALSLGYVREIVPMRAATLGLGTMGTINSVPPALASAYGSRTPVGLFLFLRLRPTSGGGGSMAGMQMN